MYCSKCGINLVDGAEFCSKCGGKVPESIGAFSNNVLDTQTEIVPEEYTFKRYKGFGKGSYSVISTVVNLEKDSLSIKQDRKLLVFFKRRLIDANLYPSEIENIVIKKSMDPSDTMFGIIFLALGVFNPILFLGAAILFWSAYGKNVILHTRYKSFLIPTSAEMELDEMVEEIRGLNPRVSIER